MAVHMLDGGIVTIEHVLPQNPAPNSAWTRWYPSSEERHRYVHQLGNLVLLSQRKNSSAQNYEFDLKKEKYFKRGVTNYALTIQVLN